MVPFSEMFKKAAKGAGLNGNIHEKLENLKRDFWMQNNEPFQHYAQRMSDELGATFKMKGDEAQFTISGENPDGSNRATTFAKWGDNLTVCALN
jgi:hypothetical protein